MSAPPPNADDEAAARAYTALLRLDATSALLDVVDGLTPRLERAGLSVVEARVLAFQTLTRSCVSMLRIMSPDHAQAYLDSLTGRTPLDEAGVQALSDAFLAQAHETSRAEGTG